MGRVVTKLLSSSDVVRLRLIAIEFRVVRMLLHAPPKSSAEAQLGVDLYAQVMDRGRARSYRRLNLLRQLQTILKVFGVTVKSA